MGLSINRKQTKLTVQLDHAGARPEHTVIALHETLLHEHHDFLLASQHPSASPALRKMASKYATPAIIWSNRIHGFLERLRRRLPGSRDHMLAFTHVAYYMAALLCETVPVFENT